MNLRNRFWKQGIGVALALAIALLMSGCPQPGNGNGNNGNELPAQTGTVSITVTPWVGQTLGVNTDGLYGEGTIYYRWMRGTTEVGTGPTYVLQNADRDSAVTVTVRRAGFSGGVSATSATVIAPPAITGNPDNATLAEGDTLEARLAWVLGRTESHNWYVIEIGADESIGPQAIL